MKVMLSYQLKLTVARLKKGTAQWPILARFFINLSWYDYTSYSDKETYFKECKEGDILLT